MYAPECDFASAQICEICGLKLLTKRICLNSKANKKYHDKMMNKMVTLDKVLEEA